MIVFYCADYNLCRNEIHENDNRKGGRIKGVNDKSKW